MPNQEIILEYKGIVTIKRIDALLIELKAKPAYRELKKTDQKRAYSIIVECLENIYKHTSKDLPELNEKILPYFNFKKQGDHYMVSSGNLISNNEINNLKSGLENINRQDRSGLKASYAEIINKESTSYVNGAGLGLITMALKSRNKIDYFVHTLDREYSFFEMRITFVPESRNPD